MAEDRIAAIAARLEAALPGGPMRVRAGYEGARHFPIIERDTGLHAEAVARTYEEDDHEHAWPRAQLFANAPADIEYLLGELEQLREDYEAAVRDMDGYISKLGPALAQLDEIEALPLIRASREAVIDKATPTSALVRAALEGYEEAIDQINSGHRAEHEADDRMLDEAGRKIERLNGLIARLLPHVNHSEAAGCPMAFHRSDGEQCTCGALDAVREAREPVPEVAS